MSGPNGQWPDNLALRIKPRKPSLAGVCAELCTKGTNPMMLIICYFLTLDDLQFLRFPDKIHICQNTNKSKYKKK